MSFVNYRVALTGEIAILLLVDSCSKGMAFYPERTN